MRQVGHCATVNPDIREPTGPVEVRSDGGESAAPDGGPRRDQPMIGAAEIPSVAFVTCVESGLLEPMTIRLFESIRRHGGRLSSSPLYAVTPRIGAPLLRATLEAYDRLGVTYIRRAVKDAFAWYAYGNKLKALALVEDIATTELLAFLDGDTLVSGEPSELLLSRDEDFAACLTDSVGDSAMGAAAANDFWHGMCAIAGMDPNGIPGMPSRAGEHRHLHFIMLACSSTAAARPSEPAFFVRYPVYSGPIWPTMQTEFILLMKLRWLR